MILSHRHRFIFLKGRKTAGTSLEIALSAYCGPDDVITPVGPPDEALRAQLGHRGPQHYEGEPAVVNPRPHRNGMRFWNHMPAAEVRAAVGEQVWKSYLRITIERDPWDKAMSMYYWRHPEHPRPPLRRFLRRQEKASARLGTPAVLSNWPIYALGDQPVADVVLEFRDLAAEADRLAARLDLPGPLRLPYAKRRHVAGRLSHGEAMGDMERDIVGRLCAREIRHFGYRF